MAHYPFPLAGVPVAAPAGFRPIQAPYVQPTYAPGAPQWGVTMPCPAPPSFVASATLTPVVAASPLWGGPQGSFLPPRQQLQPLPAYAASFITSTSVPSAVRPPTFDSQAPVITSAAVPPVVRPQTFAAQAQESNLTYSPIPGSVQKVFTASMQFDGETVEIRYGPGEDFESPADFFTPCNAQWRGPYEGMLELLSSHHWLADLPVDSHGTFSVSIPFCGSVQELPVLAPFLVERILSRPEVKRVHILGSDVENWDPKGGYWRQKERYIGKKYPGVQVQFRQLDLSRERHPATSLTVGMHPECTCPSAPWKEILSNVISNTAGLCVIGTFKDGEMEVVRDVCAALGVEYEVHLNPYWQSRPLPPGTIPPFIQYIIMARKSR